jgi:hypothetical protein
VHTLCQHTQVCRCICQKKVTRCLLLPTGVQNRRTRLKGWSVVCMHGCLWTLLPPFHPHTPNRCHYHPTAVCFHHLPPLYPPCPPSAPPPAPPPPHRLLHVTRLAHCPKGALTADALAPRLTRVTTAAAPAAVLRGPQAQPRLHEAAAADVRQQGGQQCYVCDEVAAD